MPAVKRTLGYWVGTERERAVYRTGGGTEREIYIAVLGISIHIVIKGGRD